LNPVVAQGGAVPRAAGPNADSADRWTGVWIAEDIEQIAAGVKDRSWVEGTLGVVGGGLDGLALVSDPVGALLQYGIAWLIEHVKPLAEALDWLAGDPAEIAAHAQTWRTVATSLTADADDLARTVRWDIAQWSGAAADAYRDWAAERERSLRALGTAAETMALMTDGAGMLIGTVRLMVRDAVATVVSRLIVYAGELIATAGLATAWVAEQVTTLCAAWSAKITRWLKDLIASLRRLGNLMKTIGDHVATLADRLRGRQAGEDPVPGAASRPTGAEIRRPRDDLDFEIRWADAAYEHIRAADDVSEVAETARRHGFSEGDIRLIKDHVFNDEHVLDLYEGEAPEVGRFSSNARIAEAWERLREGNPHPQDIVWMNHERYEARYMAETGDPSYRRAHAATLEAGYVWEPEAAAADGFGYQRR
jgi:uncharacterized protein YukE